MGFILHFMVSKNRCLKVNMTLNKEGRAACIALKATKYEPDIKYLSHLVQRQKTHEY
jgi:hypothetical protein